MGTRGDLLRPRKFEQSSGQVTLSRIEVTISHFPARLGQIPIELALNIGNEIVRLADSCDGGGSAFPCALPNPVKVSFGERCGRLIGSLQEPGFKLRRDFKRLTLLVARAAKHVIYQFAGVSGDTSLNLLPQEVLNVFGQSNGHGNTIPPGTWPRKGQI